MNRRLNCRTAQLSRERGQYQAALPGETQSYMLLFLLQEPWKPATNCIPLLAVLQEMCGLHLGAAADFITEKTNSSWQCSSAVHGFSCFLKEVLKIWPRARKEWQSWLASSRRVMPEVIRSLSRQIITDLKVPSIVTENWKAHAILYIRRVACTDLPVTLVIPCPTSKSYQSQILKQDVKEILFCQLWSNLPHRRMMLE